MAKTKLKLNHHPRKPEDVWFWLRTGGSNEPWHLRRYQQPDAVAVCGWGGALAYDHAANMNSEDGQSHYLHRDPPFDWEQYYLDHRDTEEFCTECIARSPWAFRLACLEAQQDGK